MTTWLLGLALGHPVQLPAEEDPEEWSSVLLLVGLEPVRGGAPADGPWVLVVDEGSRWRLRVEGPHGVREAVVEEPSDGEGREGVAQLAASLIAEVDAPSLPPLPALPPVPLAEPEPVPRPAPVGAVPRRPPVPEGGVEPVAVPDPVAVPEPVAEPVPVAEPEPVAEPRSESEVDEPDVAGPEVAEPTPRAEPEPEPAVAEAPPQAPRSPERVAVTGVVAPDPEPLPRAPRRFAPFAWGAVGFHLRSSVLPAVSGGAWAGAVSAGSRLGLGVEGTAPAGLTGLALDARVQRTSAWAGTWARVGPIEPGLVGGGQLHRYLDDRGADAVVVPTFGASVAAFPLASMRIEGRVHRDLRRVEVFVGDDRLRVAEPWSVHIGVAWVPLDRADRRAER